MRETYDCALVRVPGHGAWLHDWMRRMERQGLRNGHPRLFAQEPAGDPSWLASSCLALRRFDACLLPVESSTLSWVRTALAGARHQLQTPVLVLARDVGAVALRDLLPLGLDDFLRPDSVDELRLRIALAARRRARAQPPSRRPKRPGSTMCARAATRTPPPSMSRPIRPAWWMPRCWTLPSGRPRPESSGISSAPICIAA